MVRHEAVPPRVRHFIFSDHHRLHRHDWDNGKDRDTTMAATTAPAIIVPLCVLLLQLTLCWTINAFRPSSVRRTPMNEQSRKSRQEATAPSSASSQISRLVSSSSSLLESSSKSETVDLQSIDSILSSACPYAAIIFDIDGTLCDSWKLGYDATQTVLQNNNIPLTTPER